MSVNQNVPTCVAAGTNNGCRPNSAYRNNSQYSSVGESNYHGLHVSFVQRPTDVGEPARDLHAVEVDERCRRGVLQLADRSHGHHEGLGPVGRRPAASARHQRHRQHVDGAGDDGVGAHQPRVPGERHAAVLLGAAVQHHVRRRQPAGHDEPAAREWRGAARISTCGPSSSFRATPGSAATSSR